VTGLGIPGQLGGFKVNDRLQMLLDHFDIRETIEAYVHGCDRSDTEAVLDCYHPDSYDHHGPLKGPGHEFVANCVRDLNTYWKNCTHLLGQSRIKVDGDSAGAETFYFASLTRDEDGDQMLDQQVGRYIDRFERREDGVWRLVDRGCIQEWAYSIPLAESFVDRSEFLKGQRSVEDLSYAALGLEQGRSRIVR
jgi:ketosteroid isomerase-like protein